MDATEAIANSLNERWQGLKAVHSWKAVSWKLEEMEVY